MSDESTRQTAVAAESHAVEPGEGPPPGQGPLVLLALSIGMILMGIQLWLLTVALDLYLGGSGRDVWQLAIVSGAIFLGGLGVIWLIRRRPRVRRRGGS